jgi:hypothetical protein
LFVAMAAVLTKQMKIGLMGNCLPLHHPVRLGEELALLDNLTNGRLVVGMTRGGDFWAFNIPSAESRERFEEGWEIIRKGWEAEEPFDFHGKYWNLDYVAFLPRPLQKPFPETWIPSISAESMEWAAKNHVRLQLPVADRPGCRASDTGATRGVQLATRTRTLRRFPRYLCRRDQCQSTSGSGKGSFVGPAEEFEPPANYGHGIPMIFSSRRPRKDRAYRSMESKLTFEQCGMRGFLSSAI